MPVTFRQLVEQFLAWSAHILSPATVSYYRHHLNGFAAVAGDTPAAEVKRHVLLAWGTSWHRVQAVQRVYNWAVDDAELLDANPFARVRRPPIGMRRRVLDRATLVRLMRGASPSLRALLIALRETMARPQEVRALTWSCLTWPGQPNGFEAALWAGQVVAVLDEYKSRKRRLDPNAPRVILISPRLGRLLGRLVCRTNDLVGRVFTNEHGKPWTGNAVRRAMRRLRLRLGLAVDHRGEPVVAYTIRHTQATAASAAGIRDRVLAELMGHTSPRTTARYQHLDVRHLQEAMQILRRTRGPTRLDSAAARG